jgi:hypothetical protein
VKKTFLIMAALISFTAFAFAESTLTIMIDVAPNVLNLQRTDDKCVTVHTDIPYDEVNRTTVSLEVGAGSITPYLCKSDLRGDLVAKFSMENVRELGLTIGEYNTFTLTGLDVNEESFSGSLDILVVNNSPPDR